MTDPFGRTMRYEYDRRGNLLKTILPEQDERGNNLQVRYEYDELNRLVSLTDPGGTVTLFEYDKGGRLIA